MKAICIKNSSLSSRLSSSTYLTIGKVYEILLLPNLAPNILPKKCSVTDDNGRLVHAKFDFFKPIEEYRDEQIEQILK
jgi:hypothetical protein